MTLSKIKSGKLNIAKLNILPFYLESKVKGQESAITNLSNIILNGEYSPNKKLPLSMSILAGPTGVGKTETARQLARFFFKSEAELAILNMAEFNNVNGVQLLTGSSFEETGRLGRVFKKQDYGIILFDEIEKVGDKVFPLFLNALDPDGRFTLSDHSSYGLQKFHVLFTTNVGADVLSRPDSHRIPYEEKKNIIMGRLRMKFSPEFIGRFGGNIILFNSLSSKHYVEIAKLKLKEEIKAQNLHNQYAIKGFTKKVLSYCVLRGSNPESGARDMRNTAISLVQAAIRNTLSNYHYPEGVINLDRNMRPEIKTEKPVALEAPHYSALAHENTDTTNLMIIRKYGGQECQTGK